MAFPNRLALATRNPGKIREIMRICHDWPVQWVLATDLTEETPSSWPHVEETGQTYLDNALLKAQAVADTLGTAAAADDSGIEVDALRGAPGPLSARFAGPGATDRENLDLLIERIRLVSPEKRTGRYRCVAACVWPGGRQVWAEGRCEGVLILESRGTGGFGYDPIFVPEGERRTMAELSVDEKDAVSHRGKAFRRLGELLAAGA